MTVGTYPPRSYRTLGRRKAPSVETAAFVPQAISSILPKCLVWKSSTPSAISAPSTPLQMQQQNNPVLTLHVKQQVYFGASGGARSLASPNGEAWQTAKNPCFVFTQVGTDTSVRSTLAVQGQRRYVQTVVVELYISGSSATRHVPRMSSASRMYWG